MKLNKKLIEVALPLDAINCACAKEKQPFTRNHPRSIHIWWARRPLAAARAVIFAQMVDDPSSFPDIFTTQESQDKERQRLFRIIEDLVKWENTTNEVVLQQARNEIRQSWERTCAQNADHARAEELFNADVLPAFHDPFAGGGALPLEAQRLGLESHASDLNPVAVLINKSMIEIPPKFAGRPSVNPESRRDSLLVAKPWKGAEGLAEDVRYYGKWMRDQAEQRIGHLYPKVLITSEMVRERPDLMRYLGQSLTVIAWLWARTVKSPNPAFANVDVPLASTFMLSTKAGKEAYVDPVIENGGYSFKVKVGKPSDPERTKLGTTAGKRAAFFCVMSPSTPITYDYIRTEGQTGCMGTRLMAVVAEGERGRVYLSPTSEMEDSAAGAKPSWKPDFDLPRNPRDFKTPNYGLSTFADLFTPRQLVALTTFSDLVQEVRDHVKSDAILAGIRDDGKPLCEEGDGATAYADAVATYLAISVSRWADLSNTICSWNVTNENVRALFARQAIPMNWDYAELSAFSRVGSWYAVVESAMDTARSLPVGFKGLAALADAAIQSISASKVVSTDPPYFDNISYADLSDFFYVWLRRSLRPSFPELFSTISVPKTKELIASPYRHGGRREAELFFLEGMTQAMKCLSKQTHPAFPVTIFYAFKQSESDGGDGTTNTGWDTFLEAVIESGFTITGTWPMRTERDSRAIGLGTNALASSIVLVCRKRIAEAPIIARREFINVLRSELPLALSNLKEGNIAPVDFAQSAIGPGMALYTRYARILGAEGNHVSVGEALALINQTLDEILAEQEGDFDSDTRWALAWFEQLGFTEGDFGVAETLSKAKNTSVGGLSEAGILVCGHGKVRLLRPAELAVDWDPIGDKRLTIWEIVHHLIRVHEPGGDLAAADLVAKLGSKAEIARELCYRLYIICDRKKRAAEALGYNALVQSWPEITRLAGEGGRTAQGQTSMFDGSGEE